MRALAATLVFAVAAVSLAVAQAGPYGLAQRPMPKGTDLETLLPRKVGTFTRAALPPGTKTPVNEDLNIDYISGSDKVNVGFSIPGNPTDAHEAIKVAKDEAVATLKQARKANELKQAEESIGTPTSYYKVSDFIAWSRGGYFFYAKANSVASLDAFMKAFPF
jgi:hypothetical protein